MATSHSQRTIEVEADSLEEARRRAETEILSEGISETVCCSIKRWMVAFSLAVILIGTTSCNSTEATGVLESVEMHHTEAGRIEYTLSITLDGAGPITITLLADDAQEILNLTHDTYVATGMKPRLRLQRSGSGRWKVVEVLKTPK